MAILTAGFYQREDVVTIARELLGKYLITWTDGIMTSGIISETEAYAGINDKASHAFGNRRTGRTSIMYLKGGTAYIYLCYGIHSLFNIVTNRENIPHAVLIRGIIPAEGILHMLERTGKSGIDKNFSDGPGKVSKALGIHYSHSGLDLTKKPSTESGFGIWVEDRGFRFDPAKVKISKRIGVSYAGADANLPYRFLLET
jgi:DNA-3-methyladenine glycosylase